MVEHVEAALQFLINTQNADGGWGYKIGGMSFVEPTSFALLALSDEPALRRGLDWLLNSQRADGGWGALAGDDASGWQTALALWAMAECGMAQSAALNLQSAIQWLAGHRSKQLAPMSRAEIHVNANLSGWAWTPNTFGWVLPTAFAIIALRAAGADSGPIPDAVNLLRDRQCSDGGWNWGNPWMLENALASTLPETAIALIGLLAGGVSADDPTMARGLAALDAAMSQAQDDLNIAWAALVYQQLGQRREDLLARLAVAQAADGGWQASPHITAIASLALAGKTI